MRILHVVTLFTPDMAFGGPVRVASNLSAALRERRHDVLLVAGKRGYGDDAPTDLAGTSLRLFGVGPLLPGTGFSGLASASMWPWLDAAITGADVVHVHLARDLVTLPAAELARRRGVPYVLQPHGMVVASGNALAPVLDRLLTRRVLRGADTVCYLTPSERTSLESVAETPLPLEQLGNGVPFVARVPQFPLRPELLFCARLQQRKRPSLFAGSARRLLDEGYDAGFALVGPDEGEAAGIEEQVAAVADPQRLRWEGPLDPSLTLDRMGRATALVLPSVDEPYPMSVLEAMSVGRPVIVTDSCGLAPLVREHRCGLVIDDSPEALTDAMRRLLDDPGAVRAMSAAAFRAARVTFGMTPVTDRLETIYEQAVSRRLHRVTVSSEKRGA